MLIIIFVNGTNSKVNILLESILIVLLTKESSSLRLPAPALIGRLEELQKRRLPSVNIFVYLELDLKHVWDMNLASDFDADNANFSA